MQWLLQKYRSSLQFKAVAITVVIGLIAVAAVTAYVSISIRNGLYEHRLNQVLLDSQSSTATIEQGFQASNGANLTEIQDAVTGQVLGLRGDSLGAERELWLVPDPDNGGSSLITGVITDRSVRTLVSNELMERVRSADGQYWQSVGWERGDRTTPAIVVGSRLNVQAAGRYEVYLVYSLDNENQNLDFIRRNVLVGGIGLTFVIGLLAMLIAHQIALPLSRAAKIANDYAQGSFERRLPSHGHDELAQLSRSFNHMAETLQEKIESMAALGRVQQKFVSDVSHELRTPLTTIQLASTLVVAEKDGFDPVMRRTVELMHSQIERFEALLADLLEITRFDAQVADLDPGETNFEILMYECIALVDVHAKAHQCTMRLETEGDVTAIVDTRRVQRIVRNLLTNAIEHGEGAPVDIRIAADDNAIAVSVRDYGVGLSAEAIAHVFDRFWRADPARKRTLGGTGLGLAIALEDAILHGGKLEAWGKPHEGALFRLTLPRRVGDALISSPLPLRFAVGESASDTTVMQRGSGAREAATAISHTDSFIQKGARRD